MTGQKQLWKYQKGKADAINQRRTEKYNGQTKQSRTKKNKKKPHSNDSQNTTHSDQTKYKKNRKKTMINT